jgi:hypothetical protein
MARFRRHHPSVQKLLEGLEQKPEDRVGLTTLAGRVVSRSANNVHLAVRGGIVAIPIANLETVVFLSDSQPYAVRVTVRSPAAIRPLLRVVPGGILGEGTIGGVATVAREGETFPSDRTWKDYIGVGTCTHTDTDTITGGQLDATDDDEVNDCPADDTRE